MSSAEIQDLTVREVEEASEFGLSKEKYVALRRRWRDRTKEAMAKEILPQVEAGLKRNAAFRDSVLSAERGRMREQIRVEMEESLRKSLLAKVEAEIGKKKREEALVQLRSEKPTADCVSTFSAYLRDLETEAQALAETASDYSSGFETKHRFNRLRGQCAVIGWIGMIPVVTWMMTHGYGLGSIALWGALATILAFSIWMTYKYVSVRGQTNNLLALNRQTCSNYLLIVDEAKRIRMSVLPNAQSIAEIRDAVRALTERKNRLDGSFFPATKDLNERRKVVRVRVLEDIDPMDVLEAVESERHRSTAKETAKWSE